MVEAGGIEPPSESFQQPETTCLFCFRVSPRAIQTEKLAVGQPLFLVPPLGVARRNQPAVWRHPAAHRRKRPVPGC